MRTALREAGDILNGWATTALGVDSEEWGMFTFDERDLDELEEPMARILNDRRDKWAIAAAAVEKSDEIIVSEKLLRWATDSIGDVFAARRFKKVREVIDVDRDRTDEPEPTGAQSGKTLTLTRGGGEGEAG